MTKWLKDLGCGKEGTVDATTTNDVAAEMRDRYNVVKKLKPSDGETPLGLIIERGFLGAWLAILNKSKTAFDGTPTNDTEVLAKCLDSSNTGMNALPPPARNFEPASFSLEGI